MNNKLTKLFDSFNGLNVLIVGDVMVDSYLWGKVERISPEAPVPIVSVSKRENRMGGAANVALNIKSLGANPILCSVVGNDTKGEEFIQLLEKKQMEKCGIVKSDKRITTTKFRVIGNNVQMLRVDEETDRELEEEDLKKLYDKFQEIIQTTKIDVVIFQDYDKGVITENLVDGIVKIANLKKIPIAVDPKKKNFMAYKNVSLFKPNLKELKEGLNIDFDSKNKGELSAMAGQLKTLLNSQIIMVTLSEDGVFVDYSDESQQNSKLIPSHVRSISDVSGAGDTVISVASLCLARKTSPTLLASISNLAGGLVCEEVGVVPINKDRLLEEAKKLKP
ncbi:MAG: D-glycero-beta-D-manno-heptose-7-phosphate kinase [Chlorobi bacterium]|nr:D-glycero-beta-D-manno-heptose-7-phosphate kinase [Chlorobiota bacterium]